MLSKILKVITGTVIGLVLGVTLSHITFAYATTGAIFDIVNRAYFVALSGSPMTIGTASTDAFKIIANSTPVAVIDQYGIVMQSGKGIGQSVYVPTPVATAVAGTNDIKKGFNAIPTAAADAAACLPAVPVAGDTFEGFNEGANTVRVKACGTPGINGGAAGTYFPVATMTYFRCVAKSATAYQCGTFAVPTPAGP